MARKKTFPKVKIYFVKHKILFGLFFLGLYKYLV